MFITLAEALPIRVQLARKIQELRAEREMSSSISVSGEDDPYTESIVPNRSIDEINNDISDTISDFAAIDQIISIKNVCEKILWNGDEISIQVAINIAKEYRKELASFKSMASRPKVQRGYYSQEGLIIKALYDPVEYKEKAERLEKELNRLSALIDKKNHQVEFEFAAEKYIS